MRPCQIHGVTWTQPTRASSGTGSACHFFDRFACAGCMGCAGHSQLAERLQAALGAPRRGDGAADAVARHVQLVQAGQHAGGAPGGRQRPSQGIVGHVQDLERWECAGRAPPGGQRACVQSNMVRC